MRKGAQVNPHKYIQRVRNKEGKWVYVYAPFAKSYEQAITGTDEVKVVIAQGKPTALRIDADSFIASGPPDLVGRRLMKNTSKEKAYFGVARDVSGQLPPKYLYPENYLKTVVCRKAAKFVKASRALTGLNRKAEIMMDARDPKIRDYGLAIWLNNNTQMRIGAHDSASSVEPSERAKILIMARDNKWSPELKQKMLTQARQKTFGLLTLRNGHVAVGEGGSNLVTFRFVGKGGKENIYSTPVPQKVFALLFSKKYERRDATPETPLFGDINYKKLWRIYKDYGITPHTSRGAFADALVKELMENFRVYDGESARNALHRFNEELQTRVSEHLNHTRNITERSYLAPTTQRALQDFRLALSSQVGSLQEHYTDEISDALGEVVLWRELGVGNTVI